MSNAPIGQWGNMPQTDPKSAASPFQLGRRGDCCCNRCLARARNPVSRHCLWKDLQWMLVSCCCIRAGQEKPLANWNSNSCGQSSARKCLQEQMWLCINHGKLVSVGAFVLDGLCSMPMANTSLVAVAFNQSTHPSTNPRCWHFVLLPALPRKKAVLDPMISAKSWINSINLIRWISCHLP